MRAWEEFIDDHRSGFDGSMVIVMGCEGMKGTSVTKVLVRCGAVSAVGWDSAISIQTSDTAVLDLVITLTKGH